MSGAFIIVVPLHGRITVASVGEDHRSAGVVRDMVANDPRLSAIADLMAEMRDQPGAEA